MASISSLGIGSGLDLSGLLDQLEAAEYGKLTPIIEQQESYQTKISAFGMLESALDNLRQAAAALSSEEDFSGVKASLSSESLAATVGEDAVAGVYNIDVTQLARSYSIATEGVADKEVELGGGTIVFTVGGEPLNVEVAEDESSLEGIRDAINAADIGVVASIVNDGSAQPYRLVLVAEETGTDAQFDVDFSGVGAPISLDNTTKIEAQNAILTVNGIEITSQHNQVEEAIQGVTLNLEEIGDATLEISLDTASIENKIKNFVSVYNSLEDILSSLTSYDQESGTAGLLIGNSTVRRIESRVPNVLLDFAANSAFGSLKDLGIILEKDGTLTLDEEVLSEVIETRLDDLVAFFSGTADGSEGLSDKLDFALGEYLDDDGILDSVTEGLENSIERLQERYESAEAQIQNTMELYRTQFTQLDILITQMNSTSSYLTQQFNILSAQLSQSK